jgi:beta-glucosidase
MDGRAARVLATLMIAATGALDGRIVTGQSEVERRIDALLSQMTIEEKFGQLQQLDGHADGRFRPEHLDLARKGLLGSTLNVRGAATVNELQRAAVDGSRLKIPLLFAFDVIHGYRTVFPIPLGEAASWACTGRSRPWSTSHAMRAGDAWPRARARTRTSAPSWPRREYEASRATTSAGPIA